MNLDWRALPFFQLRDKGELEFQPSRQPDLDDEPGIRRGQDLDMIGEILDQDKAGIRAARQDCRRGLALAGVKFFRGFHDPILSLHGAQFASGCGKM